MLKTVDFYYFSPTGGTKKAGEALAFGLAETVIENDLAKRNVTAPTADIVVVAAPVFGGRIPTLVTDKIAELDGTGKTAVTAVVYGIRAYEDALLELNNAMKSRGFHVIASAALCAQHSIVPEVGAGRPNQTDITEIRQFADRILSALKTGIATAPAVPGNFPYKESMKASATPISLPGCSKCGLCVSVCPTDAVSMTDTGISTDPEKCFMCMACTAKCPEHLRVLPPELQSGLAQRLGVFKDVHRENEFYL